eukprot:Phypoly_transcript_03348.p1 GENE.Phypoly_transcript_03348~~Phypoly_transcript_03348.p1  ORF type:complete len:749 (-),score=204.22 Phypoly_transcript_03348:37-2283(-)
MFKHGAKGEEKDAHKKDDSHKKEDKKKEKERLKTEKKAEKEDKKRSATTKGDARTPRELPERSLSSPAFGSDSPQKPVSPVISPRTQVVRGTVNVDQLSLDKDDLTDKGRRGSLEPTNGTSSLHTSQAQVQPAATYQIPAQALSLPNASSHTHTPPNSSSAPLSVNPLSSSATLKINELTKSASIDRHVPQLSSSASAPNLNLLKSKVCRPTYPAPPPPPPLYAELSLNPPIAPLAPNPLSSSATLKRDGLTKSSSMDRHAPQNNISLVKSKIGSLPPETKQLVESLLNIFSRTLPDKWTAPPNLDAISLDDQIDITLDKLVEASEILFNKDAPSLLKKYGRDLRESPNRRTDKWKSIANMLGSDDAQFKTLFLTSDTLESIILSAVSKPLESDETEILADVLRLSVIHDIALKELLSVVQAASKSNAHLKNKLDETKSLPDAIVELVCSFRKLVRSSEEEFQVQDLKKEGAEVSESLNQSVSLLEHANIIKHAKGGNDIIHPLESFFQEQILEEIREGEKWQKTNEEAKEEKVARLQDIDQFISEEEDKLKTVQVNIIDLEAKLEQKKAEEKILQASLALKLKEREQYLQEHEKTEEDIKVHIEETAQHLDHHKKAEEAATKFAQDITSILDKEVSDTLKKTKEVLHELEKEVTFLEEKLTTYERSMSLFNNADEPEVLDGLRKLFARSTAIYAESKLSVSRVSSVVELLRTVLGEDSSSVEDLATNLEKIVARQNTLNHKYKLQKE